MYNIYIYLYIYNTYVYVICIYMYIYIYIYHAISHILSKTSLWLTQRLLPLSCLLTGTDRSAVAL